MQSTCRAGLKRTGFDTAVWSMTQKLPIADLPGNLDRLSEGFADQLGDLSGPLHADALQWLDANPDFSGNETDYLCGLEFTLYRETADPEWGQKARTCVAALMRNQPSAFALAMNGTLLLDAALKIQPPSGADPEPLAEAERQLSEALRLAPTLSPAWREWAFYLEAVGRFGEAEAAYTSALQLNPANLDSVAGYGRLLSLRERSDKGEVLANDALRRSIAPPYWYHEAPAINAMRSGDNATALGQAELLGAGDPELASVVATVAARRLGQEEALNRYIAQLVEVTRFRRFGILPVLRQRLGGADLRTRIGEELAAAGIDQAALDGPY
jgi:tetratricopeptide (TPR) repeat protein